MPYAVLLLTKTPSVPIKMSLSSLIIAELKLVGKSVLELTTATSLKGSAV